MSTSSAILWLGPISYAGYSASGYAFNPTPQVGCRDDYQRAGESKMAPTNKRRLVTLHGHFTGASLNAVQGKVATLRTALSKENQVLYFHDGSAVRISDELVTVDSLDIPVQWGQYHTDYTVGLSYYPLDDVHKAPAAVSYGSYKFCDLNGSQPIPVLGKEYKVERQSPDADRESARVTLSLSGFFEAGSISGNQDKLNTLNTALATDNLTLVYGSFSQTVKVLGWTHHEDTLQRRIGYSIQFQYIETARDNGIIKMSSMRRITRVTQRYVAHLVPFIDFASVQTLGRGGQKISATGYVICDTLANARLAAQIEFDSQFPSGGVEDPSSTVVEYPEQHRVDWQIEKFYGTPALIWDGVPGSPTGLYGNGL